MYWKQTKQLLSDDKTGKYYNTSDRLKLTGIPKTGLEIDSNGSIIWKPEPEVSNYSSISGAMGPSASRPESPITPMGQMGAESAAPHVSPFVQLIKLIKRGSYVGTLIVMMVCLTSNTQHLIIDLFVAIIGLVNYIPFLVNSLYFHRTFIIDVSLEFKGYLLYSCCGRA